MAKQNDTKYHYLYLTLKEADDYFPKEDRKELLEIIDKLYSEYEDMEADNDDNGTYGLRYKTIQEDSRYTDTHEQFFSSKEKRDNVLEDWEKREHWDSILDKELSYPTPTPNYLGSVKVFKYNGKIYEE